MSNNITLKNPVALTAPSAMSAAKKSIDQNSQSLSTGVKANNDVVSTFLGNGLADQAKIGSKILDSMGYSKGILSTAMGSLNSSANNISDMISTVVASSGASEEVLASLNDSLNQKLESLKLQISSTEYNGRKILNGDLGSDSSVRSNFTNKAVSVKKMDANAKFLGESHAGTSTVKFGDNSKITPGDNGDSIVIGSVTFKFVDNGVQPDFTKLQIAKGSNAEDTARNFVESIRNSGKEELQAYGVKVINKSVIITPISGGAVNVNVTSNAGGVAKINPSTQTLTFCNTAAAAGDTVSVGGVTFTYALAADPKDPDSVAHGVNATESMNNLEAAIRKHPTLQNYVNQGALVVTRSTSPADAATKNYITFQQNFETKAGFDLKSTAAVVEGATQDGTNQFILTFSAARADTNRVIIDGVTFTYNNNAANAGIAVNGTLNKGTGQNDSAESLKLAIEGDATLRARYTVTRANAVLTITSASGYVPKIDIPDGTPANLVITTGSAGAGADAAGRLGGADEIVAEPFAAKVGGIDVSGLKNVDAFINQVKPEITVTAVEVGLNARTVYQAQTRNLPVGNANAGDVTVLLEAKIGGRIFTGAAFRANAGNLSNQKITFKEQATGESFSITTGNPYLPYAAPAGEPNITTKAAAQASLGTDIKTFIEGATFAQTKSLVINTDAGEIISEKGGVIGSVKGMAVSLTSTDFTNKNFSNFVVEQNKDDPKKVNFTATIDNADGSKSNFVLKSVDPSWLVKGYSLVLTDVNNGDKLTINLGDKGLTDLSDVSNFNSVGKAITASLTSSGSGLDVRVGLGFNDVLTVKIPEVGINKLMQDDQGNFVEKFDISDREGAATAQKILTRALGVVRSAISNIQGQSETIDSVSEYLTDSVSRMKDASSQYLDADIVESSTAFSAAVKSIQAAIYTLQAGARVSDAALQIIQAAAAA